MLDAGAVDVLQADATRCGGHHGFVQAGINAILFAVVGLQNAATLGMLCGYISLIPFLGGILSTLIALAAAVLQFDSAGRFIALALSVPMLHLFGMNYMVPRLLGPRLLIGPFATTVGMSFWGWLRVFMGLLLAVPLTAFIKLVADSHPRLNRMSGLLSTEAGPARGWTPFGRPFLQQIKSWTRSGTGGSAHH